VVFAQGCPHRCPGCHNPHTHDFSGGEAADTRELALQIREDPLLSGVTFSGGEPFEQCEAFSDLADLVAGIQERELNIICYTGYTFEELLNIPEARILLEKIDILIDGHFDKHSKSYELKFKGSANQRVISAKESIRLGKVVETIL
jgi:anaerobic ribonucleoside-triphosphate reductase activating protein